MTARRAGHGTVVLDLDGVLYLDSSGVPGAADALRALEDDGWRLVYATNNSTKTGELVARHIRERIGFDADPDAAVTSAMAAASHVRGSVRTASVVGAASIDSELRSVGVSVVELGAPCDAVVVGLDRELTYERIDRAARSIRSGARFVATNTDPTYPTPTGLAPGAGTVVAAIAAASGVEPEPCGKPHAPFADLVARRVGDGPIVMVGDRPDTDIALGKRHGWRTVLVLSGVTPDPGVVPPDLAPDDVVDTVADLPALLAGSGG